MTLISKVAKLQKRIPPDPGIIDLRFTKDLLAVAPSMIAALGHIQPGDAIYLDMILGWLGGSVFTQEFSEEEYEALTILFDMVKRLQAMCQEVEKDE
jgi:hypothetical protein